MSETVRNDAEGMARVGAALGELGEQWGELAGRLRARTRELGDGDVFGDGEEGRQLRESFLPAQQGLVEAIQGLGPLGVGSADAAHGTAGVFQQVDETTGAIADKLRGA
ncbi:hypothetical protein OG819_40440 [Streptomyces sp. NBC_01549]|uniref:hypothetical protein n=1 Tax=Streptomyces sp. NBC_01549 TaxID=2975874 RepID=UPI0022519782|nr:hypothetical protein [Streptomyces sp. NBC_01549]MCX4595712.1 hypothetical protein [Streptomyces sp. NBC_01549]